MKFPYLAPRSALGPIRLDTYVERERVNIMADNVREREGELGSSRKGTLKFTPPARMTPEYKQWHSRQMRKLREK